MRPIPIDRWRGEYFNNTDLSGAPVMVRDDTQAGTRFLDFDWKLGSPGEECGGGVDNFSARWTRTVALAAGSYRFTVTSDDGVRLLIDGQERLNQWNDHPLTTHTVDLLLAAGNHRIVLEYYERWGSAAVSLKWEQHPCIATVASDHWRGEYFNNDSLNGEPLMVRDDGTGGLSFDFRQEGPSAVCGITETFYSARWSSKAALNAGVYRFSAISDGGMRVYVDGQLKLDQWRSNSTSVHDFDLLMTPGNHQLVFEYRRRSGRSRGGLSWKQVPCQETVQDDHWRGEYFNSDNLTGQAVMVRDDGDRQIDFNWGEASPSETCGVRRDSFSVRWTRAVTFTAGLYRFIVAGNDGLRFYVDGELKLDQWREQSASFIADVELTGGRHQLKLEYVDFGGKASVKLAWQPPPCIAAVPAERWRGEYFANQEMAGRPMVVRDEGTGKIDFDWGLGRPHTDCFNANDNFSARWSRTVSFAAGTYRFNVAADDGVRLIVDGKRLIDEWHDQPTTKFSVDVELTGGTHRVVLEYYENSGSALVGLSWSVAPCTAVVAAEHWRGEYFNNPEMSGNPAMVQDDGDGRLNFDWGLKGPDSNCGIGVDNFSARWTRNVPFAEGIYRFNVTADDGARIFIDGQLKFDRWQDQAITQTFDVPLTGGNHQIRVEYFEHWGSAALKLSWVQHPCFATVPPERWRGEYFNNANLTGQPVMIRDDGDSFLAFDWGAKSASAECGVNADDFSARWSRRLILLAGVYRFTVTGDDGVRLMVNGKRLIDEWRDQAPATFTREVFLPAGNHRIVLEYYDRTGGATAKLEWLKIEVKQK
ncbi:MAG: PA14 domain-containing protein [Acidobacteriota bacterium]